jgi:hypothetical protein
MDSDALKVAGIDAAQEEAKAKKCRRLILLTLLANEYTHVKLKNASVPLMTSSMAQREFLAGAMASRAAAVPKTRAAWAAKRRKTLANMQRVMGELRPPSGRPLDVARVERTEEPRLTRTYLTFAGDDHDHVPAYLVVPKALRKRAPAICVCTRLHVSLKANRPK